LQNGTKAAPGAGGPDGWSAVRLWGSMGTTHPCHPAWLAPVTPSPQDTVANRAGPLQHAERPREGCRPAHASPGSARSSRSPSQRRPPPWLGLGCVGFGVIITPLMAAGLTRTPHLLPELVAVSPYTCLFCWQFVNFMDFFPQNGLLLATVCVASRF
jgi:hypothetical protein